jgi:hypothetical protein
MLLMSGHPSATDSIRGLRDRALLGVMAYTFARIGAVLNLNVEDYYWCPVPCTNPTFIR